jgi:hypothetical protein
MLVSNGPLKKHGNLPSSNCTCLNQKMERNIVDGYTHVKENWFCRDWLGPVAITHAFNNTVRLLLSLPGVT